MKKICDISLRLALALSCGLLVAPTVSAQAVQDITPIVITEMQPGTALSASQEFVELYNQSDEAIDLEAGQWRLQITTSKATTWDKAKSIALKGTLKPGGYALVASSYMAAGETKKYLQDYAIASFTPGLTGTSGHIRLVKSGQNNTDTTIDWLEWTTREGSQFVSPPITSPRSMVLTEPLATGSSAKRIISDNIFHDTQQNDTDFMVSLCPSPTSVWSPATGAAAPIPTAIDTEDQACIPEQPEDDVDPLPQPTEEPPSTLLPSEQPRTSTTASQPKIPGANMGLAVPQLTELLPNPGSPQTDAQDEFFELYNSNGSNYDLSGYMIVSGVTSTKRYVFPQGTVLKPKSFVAFFSGDTKVSLVNANGQVRLLDPLGREISATNAYDTAKDNQVWARGANGWQWSTQPTPNASNIIRLPVGAKKAATTKASSSKAQTASAAQKNAKTVQNTASTVEEPAQKTPLHPLALAVVGGFALLYGAYEYRRDMANRFYQLRKYRAARREARAQLEGR